MYKILSISMNTRLLLQRNDTLALAGFRVISPRTPDQAPFLAFEQKVDAVIIGHSVDPQTRSILIQSIRQLCPKCVIAFVYVAPEEQTEPLADLSLDVTHGNEPLVRALEERLPREIAAD